MWLSHRCPEFKPLLKIWTKTMCQVQCGSEIWSFEIQKHFKSWLFDGRISNGRALAMAIAPTIWKPDIFIWILNAFFTKWWPFVQISNGLASGYQIPKPKSGPFATQPLIDHSKSRLVQISDSHCVWKVQCLVFKTILETELVSGVRISTVCSKYSKKYW